MELAIRTDVYQPKIENGKETGLLEYVKQRTFGELKSQLVAVLDNIDMGGEWECSAYGAAEYLSFQNYDQDEKAALPKGGLHVLVREGRCEGYRLELLVEDSENGTYMPLMSAKYLSGKDEIWNVAKQVDVAIQNGLYGY